LRQTAVMGKHCGTRRTRQILALQNRQTNERKNHI
jgi:hypothetical protein